MIELYCALSLDHSPVFVPFRLLIVLVLFQVGQGAPLCGQFLTQIGESDVGVFSAHRFSSLVEKVNIARKRLLGSSCALWISSLALRPASVFGLGTDHLLGVRLTTHNASICKFICGRMISLNTDSCFTISHRDVITDRSTQQLSKNAQTESNKTAKQSLPQHSHGVKVESVRFLQFSLEKMEVKACMNFRQKVNRLIMIKIQVPGGPDDAPVNVEQQ